MPEFCREMALRPRAFSVAGGAFRYRPQRRGGRQQRPSVSAHVRSADLRLWPLPTVPVPCYELTAIRYRRSKARWSVENAAGWCAYIDGDQRVNPAVGADPDCDRTYRRLNARAIGPRVISPRVDAQSVVIKLP